MSRKKQKKRSKKQGKKLIGKTPSSQVPKKHGRGWFKKIFTRGISGVAILAIISIVLEQFPVTRGFSIETTAKGIRIFLQLETEKSPLQITEHPAMNNLIVSAEMLNISTSEFIITETNEPTFKGAKQSSQLKIDSTEATYYHIQNHENVTIPVIISIYPKQKNAKIEILFNQDKNGLENITSIVLPPCKASLDMSTKQTTLTIKKSKISYNGKQVSTNGKEEVRIKGKPYKIDINMEGSENTQVNLSTKKETTYHIQPNDQTIRQIDNLEFHEASEETTIYLDPMEKVPIKENFIIDPNIAIEGKIKSVKKLEVTDKGISATLEGEYVKIKIAETELKNTALDEVLRFIKRIPEIKK